jgi:hypothetical protein
MIRANMRELKERPALVEQPGRWAIPRKGTAMSNRTCSIAGCGRIHKGHGYCNLHYRRWRKGSDLSRPIIGAPFWDWVDQSDGLDGCWPWLGHANSDGYGLLNKRLNGQWLVHRVVYQFAHGQIDSDLIVRHACDNPPCCNPLHLLGGTQADNVRDAIKRERFPRGESHGNTKVTDAQVRDIREAALAGETYTSIGARFGISRYQVSNIAHMKQRRAA